MQEVKQKMTNESQDNARKISLDTIVQNETIVGFRVEGFERNFDGVDYSGTRTYSIAPAGEDAPGVFRVIVMNESYSGKPKRIEDRIVTGFENAMKKAYSLALNYAQNDVTHINEWVDAEEKNERKIGRYRRAILVDNAKDKLKI